MYLGRVELMYALSEFPVRALVAVWSNWCLARAILGLHSTCVMPHALRTTENDPRDTDRYCWVCLDLALPCGCDQQIVAREIRGANGSLVGFDLLIDTIPGRAAGAVRENRRKGLHYEPSRTTSHMQQRR